MEIINTRILASVSRNYQKAEVEMVVSEASQEDLEYVENLCISEAMKVLNQISENDTPANINTSRSPIQNPSKPTPRTPRAPMNQPAKFQNVTPKQANVLRKAGYSDEQISLMSSREAAATIQKYWAESGYTGNNNYQGNRNPYGTREPQYDDYPGDEY